MMADRNISGEKLAYRPVLEAELSTSEKLRIREGQSRAERQRHAQENLIGMAGRDRAGFERMARWIVATCRVGSEEAIAAELDAVRIETWCPREKFRTRPRRKMKPVDIYRPFFRGYLFVRVMPCHEAYAGVLCASRLGGIMGSDGRPFLMPEKLMDALMLSMRKRQCIQDDEVKLPFSIAERVRVADGAFSGFKAMVRALLPDRWQAEVEVEIFGRMTPMTIDIDSLESET